jgi:hypothetical protein
MIRFVRLSVIVVALLVLAGPVVAQESKAAMATRQKLKQVIAEIDLKDIGTKAFFEDVNRELDKQINFRINSATGVSNNAKLTYKAKKVTVEKLLNDISDKYEFGWVVISNPANNKIDGSVEIRKSDKGKERGYEAGKEPKKTSSLGTPLDEPPAAPRISRVIWADPQFRYQAMPEPVFDR